MRGNIWSGVKIFGGVQDGLALLSTAVLSAAWTTVPSAVSAAVLLSAASMAVLLRTISAAACADLLSASYAAILSAAIAFAAVLSTGYRATSVCSTLEERSNSNSDGSSQSV